MFCHKCGNKLAEGAAFCNKCGAKAASNTIVLKTQNNLNDENDFKLFVDNHVRMTTKFQSAKDLIMNSKPMSFIWICIVSLVVFGMLLGAIKGEVRGIFGGLLVGCFFGYAAVFIVSGIIRSKYRAKFSGKVEQKIDPENFLAFLNEHLRIISPYFHDCGYLDQRGGMLTILSNALSDAMKEVNLCCECGENEKKKKRNLAVICIRPDVSNPSSGMTQYFASATYNGFLIDRGGAGFLAHSCLIKTAPVLQAAIEYYVKNKIL